MNPQSERTNALLDVLMGLHWESLIALIPQRVLVRVSSEASLNPQGQLITTFLLNLLMRLYPVVSQIYLEIPQDTSMLMDLPRWRGETFVSTIKAIYESIGSSINLSIIEMPPEVDICYHITIGPGRPLKMPGVWVGSNNWVAKLSSSGPIQVNSTINPVGAYVAATLAVSETWKRILMPLQNEIQVIKITPLDGTLYFSTFDYTQTGDGENPILPDHIDIKRLTMIGLGAGGGATAFTLASIPRLQGTINLIDPDEIETSNLNRYVFADNDDATRRRPKVVCVSKLFTSHSQVWLRTWYESYQSAKSKLEIEDYRRVISAVHSREARRALQYETPGVILDAASTEQGDFFIWRMILGETECMFCKHPQNEDDPEREQAKQLSKLLGLDPETWLRKTGNNEMFTGKEIEIINSRFDGQELPFDLPRLGQRCSEWFANQCGRLDLPELEEEIPIPFAPVMAGILLAGEVIKEHLFPKQVLQGYYWNNLTARFIPNLLAQRRKPREGCKFCGDMVFLEQYTRRWGRQR